jgi:uncharacterized protein
MPASLIIDSDTHVAEARDVWTSRMSSNKWGELVPHVRWDEEHQRDTWYVGDKPMGPTGICSHAVRDPQTGERRRWDRTYPELPARFEDMHPSAYEAEERVKVMDEYGIHAAVLYPNLNFVVSDLQSQVDDPQFKLDTVQAYNDFLVEEWANKSPERLIALALVPYFDAKVAAQEVYRAKEIGHKGLVMTGAPHAHGQPFLADRYWDPLWQAAAETNMPISFHVGGGDISAHVNMERLAVEGTAALSARGTTAILFDNAIRLNDLLMSGVLPRFPDTKFVCVETGIGWVNFCMESADFHFQKAHMQRERPEFEELPSFYFRRQVYTTYWFETLYPFHIDRLGADKILFETDYPHSTSLEEHEVEWAVNDGMSMVSDEVKQRVLWKNAAELYELDVPDTATAA